MSLFKNKLPLLAAIAGVVCAVGTTAFTKASNPPDTYTFAYQPTTYGHDDVQKVSNWAIGSPGCGGDNRACEITVQEQFTHPEGSTRVLNDASAPNHVTIVAEEGGNQGEYMVDKDASTNIDDASNKQ